MVSIAQWIEYCLGKHFCWLIVRIDRSPLNKEPKVERQPLMSEGNQQMALNIQGATAISGLQIQHVFGYEIFPEKYSSQETRAAKTLQ